MHKWWTRTTKFLKAKKKKKEKGKGQWIQWMQFDLFLSTTSVQQFKSMGSTIFFFSDLGGGRSSGVSLIPS